MELIFSFLFENVKLGVSVDFLQRFVATAGIIVLFVVAVAAVCVYLWHVKETRSDRVFTVTREGLSEQSEKIAEVLSQLKASKREVTNALLLLEEIVVRLQEQAGQTVTAYVNRFLGSVRISLSASGEPFNPFENIGGWEDESEDAYRNMIFRANRTNLSYARHGKKNCVTIIAHSVASRSIYFTLAAMVLGIAFGFGMKFMPVSASAFIVDNVLSTVQTIFLNALSLLLAPVLFFTLANSFSSLAYGKEIGRISGKVVGSFLFTTVMAIVVGLSLGAIFFGGSLPQLPQSFLSSAPELAQGKSLSVSSMLIGIVPRNVINPITDGNMVQVVFFAVFFGIALSALGDKAATIRTIFSEASEVFLKMMSMIIVLIPLIAFVSMALLVFASEATMLFVLLGYFGVLIFGVLLLFALYSLILLVFCRISPIAYIKKTFVYLLTPFMIASSSACIPLTIDFCKRKLGVSNKIASFVISLGANVNMNGLALHLMLSTVLLSKMCNVPLDAVVCLKIGITTILIAVGCAGVPNAGIICLALLLPVAGIPVGAIGFLLGIWSIIDRLGTAANVNGNIVASLVVAKSEEQLDLAVYKA